MGHMQPPDTYLNIPQMCLRVGPRPQIHFCCI